MTSAWPATSEAGRVAPSLAGPKRANRQIRKSEADVHPIVILLNPEAGEEATVVAERLKAVLDRDLGTVECTEDMAGALVRCLRERTWAR
jgi:hypothetical protein